MNKLLFYSLFIITYYFSYSQPSRITNFKHSFLNEDAIKNAITGIEIRELQKGKKITGHNENRLFIPASTLKSLYVFSVLEKYPDNFHWETSLLFNGQIKEDTLQGNIIIRSGGDPAFGGQIDTKSFSQLLEEMVLSIQSLGIRVINGNVELQMPANYYPAHGSWPIEDIGNYYGTGYWGFNYNDNTYKLYLKTGQPGEKAEIFKTDPFVPHLNIHNLSETVAPDEEDTSYLYGDPTSFNRTLIGHIPQQDSQYVIKGGIPYPPLNFIAHFVLKLNENNITVTGKSFVRPKISTFPDEKVLWIHTSPSLLTIAKRTLDKSVNMYSEALARLLIENEAVSDRYLNKDSINHFFRQSGFHLIDLEDGSGLAPDNLIAPSEFTTFLIKQVRKHGLKRVLDILPHAGEDGYAKYFLKNSPVQKNVWVKSGSVSKVQNYIGIFRGKSGKYYVFAIMVNHFSATHKEVKKAIETYLENLINRL